MICFLAPFSAKPCSGRLIRAHLLPRQLLKREFGPTLGKQLADDHRSYVYACSGISGIGAHHGELDHSRTLKIPRHMLPAGVEDLAAELGLTWWLSREYGELEDVAA